VALVAISVDAAEKTRPLADKLHLTMPLLSDADRSVMREWGVEDTENEVAWPSLFIVGSDGSVRWRSLAETYKVRPAAAVVLDALAGL
jgi:peroxiredoxin